MSEIFCSIRRERVADLPEERVRQNLIERMVSQLGYPKHSLVVEKALHQFPHIRGDVPDCRVDIACFAKGIHPRHPFHPLLIIECKAVPITSKVLEQVIGYNFYCEAPFIAVANSQEIRLGWLGSSGYEYIHALPPYQDLLRSISL